MNVSHPGQVAQIIELKVNNLSQLFNSMDPSPFRERDLADSVEEFIVSWARELPRESVWKLRVHVPPAGLAEGGALRLEEAIRNYFAYRAEGTGRELRVLLREGRIALVIGVAFMTLCQLLAQALNSAQLAWVHLMVEGVTIVGWVAMWRPLEMHLYQWWPILARRRLYRRLSTIEIEISGG